MAPNFGLLGPILTSIFNRTVDVSASNQGVGRVGLKHGTSTESHVC